MDTANWRELNNAREYLIFSIFSGQLSSSLDGQHLRIFNIIKMVSIASNWILGVFIIVNSRHNRRYLASLAECSSVQYMPFPLTGVFRTFLKLLWSLLLSKNIKYTAISEVQIGQLCMCVCVNISRQKKKHYTMCGSEKIYGGK